MDTWKFYDITHREHVVCNPTSEEKLARLVELLRLPPDARVVDIACGKGEFLIRLAEAYGVRGVGIDHLSFLHRRRREETQGASAERESPSLKMNGADFKPTSRTASVWRHVSVPVGSSVDTLGLWTR